MVAGHQGKPAEVVKKDGAAGADASRGHVAAGTLATEKPLVCGMIQRGGEVVIRMRENVQQRTIQPLLQATMAPGTCIDPDEYAMYRRLEPWGNVHESVCHSRGE